jgi:hypothetical protein
MPAAPLNCLENLVGLAAKPLPCFPFPTDSDTAWITESTRRDSPAGPVYVSELQGLDFKPAKSDPATDLYDRLGNARKQAAAYVRQNITQAGGYSFSQPRFAASGNLGKPGNGAPYSGPASIVLQTAEREGGGYVLTGLGLQTTTAVLAVPILLDGVQVATVDTNQGVQPVSKGYAPQFNKDFIGQITIPFDGQAHTLTAVLPDGVRPLDGQLYCTTGCNSKAPGTFGASVAQNLPLVTSATRNAGFLLQVKEQCIAEAADVLCYAASGTSDDLADSLAQAVVAMTAHFYLMGLFSIKDYSRYTLLDTKQMEAMGAYFKAEADKNIAWLAQPNGLGRVQHPCFACAPNPNAPYTAKHY